MGRRTALRQQGDRTGAAHVVQRVPPLGQNLRDGNDDRQSTRLVTGGVDTHLDVTDGSDVLFFGNITNHQADLADALRERALCGFPAAGGAQDGRAVRYVLINQQRTMPGERDGTMTSRVRELQGVLNGAGFPTVISANIDRRLQGPPRLLCRSHSPSTASDVVVEAVHSGAPFSNPCRLPTRWVMNRSIRTQARHGHVLSVPITAFS